MAREIFAENNAGKAVVRIEHEVPVVEYFDASGRMFFNESYPDKTYSQAVEIAEDWAAGYHVLFEA